LRPRHLFHIARLGPTIPTSTVRPRAPGQTARSTGLRLWQTPDRARLAQILLDDR
jgi:hypothetical protein